MLFYLQVIICLGFVFLLCFLFGKRFGEAKSSKMREELRSYELAFNQLLEQMDFLAKNNLKVLEAKTNEFKDLITIVDQKSIYLNDLLQEASEESLNRKSFPPSDNIDGIKIRREIQELIAKLNVRMKTLEEKIQFSEKNPKREKLMEEEFLPKFIEKEKIIKLQDNLPPSISKKQEKSFSIISPDEKVVQMVRPPRDEDHSRESPFSSGGAQFLFPEVINLVNQGFTSSQIAKKLSLGQGEVELIVNIHATKPSLRKVT